MNTLTPGRADFPAYATDDAGQSLADEQRLEAKARELAADAFAEQDSKARAWLDDVSAGECSSQAFEACREVMRAAIYAALHGSGAVELSLAVDRLLDCYVDARNEDYDADAAEDLAEIDADCAADFEVES